MLPDPLRPPAAAGPGSEPTSYVPRRSCELALAELSELIGKTPACAALTGAAGLGKTRLLHVLRERLAGFECLYLARPGAETLWSELAVAAGLGSGDDDRGAVLGRARTLAGDGSGLVLLVDDAESLPAEAAASLIAACETPGLSVVMAFDSGEPGRLADLPAEVRRVDLGPPLTLPEARAYALVRLRDRDPEGPLGARLDARTLEEMYEASAGIPAHLNERLDAWRREVPDLDRLRAVAVRRTRVAREAARIALPRLPQPLRELRSQLERPLIQLGLAVIFVLLIGGFWLFAMERSGGVASIGVPVDRFEAPARPDPVPQPPAVAEPEAPSTAPATPALPTPTAPAEDTGPLETPSTAAGSAAARLSASWSSMQERAVQLLKRSEVAMRVTARE